MAALALSAYLAFILVAFGWRSWLQYRRTGESGFRGLSGGSPQWAAVLVAGAVASFLAPIADLGGVLPAARGLTSPATYTAGIFALGIGFALTVLAQLQMGASWRIGVDPSEATALVTHGVFRFVRNPIFTGMLLVSVGLALLVPNVLSLAGALLLWAGIEVHVRRVEEPYLLGTHGERYRVYASSVGRFVPLLGLLR